MDFNNQIHPRQIEFTTLLLQTFTPQTRTNLRPVFTTLIASLRL